MYYVYMIKSEIFSEQIYIGFTTNLKQRLKVHNSGGSVYTAHYKPWRLNTYLAFDDKNKALEFESYLKSNSGRAFAKKRLW